MDVNIIFHLLSHHARTSANLQQIFHLDNTTLVDGTVAGVVSTLRCKALRAAKVLNTTQQDLQHAVSDTGSIPRELVSRKTRSVKGKTSLLGPHALVARAGKSTAVVLGVVWCVEKRGRVLIETLGAVPGHVLDGEEGAVCAEQHVQVATSDDGVVGVFDDALEDAVVGRADGGIRGTTAVIAVAEDVDVGALHPIGADDGVERLLNVRAVEVDLGTRRLVVARVDYSELRERMRASLGDMVNVETRVDLQDGRVEVVELVASVVLRVEWVGENWNGSLRRREGEILIVVVRVATFLVMCADSLHERVVQKQKVLPELNVWENDDLLLDCFITNYRIIDTDTSKVEVLGIVGLNEAICDVWDVVAGIRLASDVCLPVVEAKEIDEALVETTEFCSELNLISNVRCSLRETDSNRLFNPEHVGHYQSVKRSRVPQY